MAESVAESESGETLSRDGVTHVVRIGPTVRRPTRPSTATVQAYLAHVRSRGFTACPEPLANHALTSRAAAEVDPVFRRWWEEGQRERMPRAVAWLAAESAALEHALR